MALKTTESTALGELNVNPRHSQPLNLPVTGMTAFQSLQNNPGKALATGDHATAVFRYGQASNPVLVGLAELSDQGGYKSISNNFEQYAHGDLPYTVILDPPSQRAGAAFPYPIEAEADPSVMPRNLAREFPLTLADRNGRMTTRWSAAVRSSASQER